MTISVGFPPEQVIELARVLRMTADELMPILYPVGKRRRRR
jgi:hypothetical protein